MTKSEFAKTLGMSYSTFHRRCIELGIKTAHGLMGPDLQEYIIAQLKDQELIEVKKKKK